MMECRHIVLVVMFPPVAAASRTTPVLCMRLAMHTEQSGALGLSEHTDFTQGDQKTGHMCCPRLPWAVVIPSSSAGTETPALYLCVYPTVW